MSLDKFIARAEKQLAGGFLSSTGCHKVITALKEAKELIYQTHIHIDEAPCAYEDWLEKWDKEFKDE